MDSSVQSNTCCVRSDLEPELKQCTGWAGNLLFLYVKRKKVMGMAEPEVALSSCVQ